MAWPRYRWRYRRASRPAKTTTTRIAQSRSVHADEGAVDRAKTALQAVWGRTGLEADAADACRPLSVEQLRLVEAWIPVGTGGTAVRCQRARQIVRGILREKGGVTAA